MKILVISKPTDALRMLPPEVQLNLVESFMKVYELQRKEGKILELYATPTGCSVVVLNYDSADEWAEDQKDMPILNYYDFEIYPLADGAAFLRRTLESLRAMVSK